MRKRMKGCGVFVLLVCGLRKRLKIVVKIVSRSSGFVSD